MTKEEIRQELFSIENWGVDLVANNLHVKINQETAALKAENERLRGKIKSLYFMYNREVMYTSNLDQHWEQFKTENNL